MNLAVLESAVHDDFCLQDSEEGQEGQRWVELSKLPDMGAIRHRSKLETLLGKITKVE